MITSTSYKKLIEKLSKFSQTGALSQSDYKDLYKKCITSPSGTQAIQPSAEITDYLNSFKQVKFFAGGSRKEWQEIIKLGKNWIKLSLRKGLNVSLRLKVKRVGKINTNNFSQYIFKNSLIVTHNIRNGMNPTSILSMLEIGEFTGQIIDDAIVEKVNGKEGLACIEAEILKRGGLMIGAEGNNLYIHFLLSEETMMDRLLGRNKPKEQMMMAMNILAIPMKRFEPFPPQPLIVPWGKPNNYKDEWETVWNKDRNHSYGGTSYSHYAIEGTDVSNIKASNNTGDLILDEYEGTEKLSGYKRSY